MREEVKKIFNHEVAVSWKRCLNAVGCANKKLSCRNRVSRLHLLYSKTSVRLPVAERKRFPRVTAVSYTLWQRCYIERYSQR